MDTKDNKNTPKKYYKPKNKKERDARRRIWDRYTAMRDDPLRKEQEQHWEDADKTFMQWMPEREEGDWRAHIALPDAFSAVQTHMQETIDRRSRPVLESVEHSDTALEQFNNSIFKYSMDRTGFDYQEFLAKQCAAIRGTAFVREYYRLDKRDVQDPVSVNDDGTLKYVKKEIIDFDDAYTEYVENEWVFIDPAARHQDMLRDWVYREVLDFDSFNRKYGKRNDFMNVDIVPKAGSIDDNQVSFFKMPKDMTNDDVEVLHYENRETDSYDVLANNVLIRMAPLDTKHKELSLAMHTHYKIPGSIWGMGIPRIIYSLTEERKSLRNLQLDRQHMNIDKMFIVNDLIDLDEEEVRTRPNGFIHVNTNGLPLDNIIKDLQYGDTPASYYKAEEMLLEDIRRAHGISDQLQNNAQGGTATEAAILKETSQKRISLINTLCEMETITRIGKIKWSNIQFFYPAPRIERIMEDNEEREKKTYRSIKVQGLEFKIVESNGEKSLKMNDIDGTSGFKLDKAHARFMENDYDVVVNGEANVVLSKPLQQAKITEMFNLIALNPQLMAEVDPKKSLKRYLTINDESPKDWLRGAGMTDSDWQRLAIHENMVMAAGQPISPTKDAPTIHTEEHLNFAASKEYDALPDAIKHIFDEHIMGEHQNNPTTGSAADALPGATGAAATGMAGDTPQGGTPSTPQVADVQAGSVGGADKRDQQQESIQQ